MTDFPPTTADSLTPTQPNAQPAISGPLTLGTLMDRAFRLYRNHFGLLLATAAIFLVPLGVVTGIFTGSFMSGYMGMIENMINLGNSPSGEPEIDELLSLFAPLAGMAGFYVLLIIATLLLQGIVTLALTAHTLAFLRNEVLTIRESISIAMSRLLAYIGKSVVQGLIIFGATLGVLLVFGCAIVLLVLALGGGAAFLDGTFDGGEPSPVAFMGIFAAVICLYIFTLIFVFIPALYLSGRYIAATIGLVDQNWGAVESLRKSWALTKGKVWRCIGYFFLLGILTLVIINLPIGIAQNIIQIFVNFEDIGLLTGLFAGATSLMAVLWTPFQVAAIVLFYMDLRVRQEDYDLELRLEQLEGASEVVV